jgi:anti-sigma regulatory factor (Ser/Thr protein kinase)
MPEGSDNGWPQERIRLTLPNDIAHVGIARDAVRAAARRYDYSASDLDHWDQVIEEAVGHVIQLAFDPDERASFDIDCLQGAAGLTVRIRDRGRPFDPRRIQPIGFGGDVETAHQRGLGWHMMQQLMDVVTLEFLGREGQQLTLFKAAPARFERASVAAVAAPPMIHEPESDIRCRRATPDDAAEVTRLFYDCYHYSYFNEQIYHPEALAEMMARGDIDCMVAELPSGRLIGHSALIHYPDRPRAIETGMAVIDPAYRGHGILGRLQQLTNDEFARSGKIVRFGGAVTAHAVSQKSSIHNGNNEVGLMLGAVPAEDFSSLETKAQGRGTIVYMAALLGSRPPPQIVLPTGHEAFIARLYQQSRIAFVPGPAASAGQEHTDMTVSVRPKVGTVRASVLRIGADLAERTKALMHAARQSRTEVGQMFLPLGDPALPEAVEALERLGWFVTGMMPEGNPAGDVLLMHWLNGWAMDYDAIAMARDEGLQLVQDVRNRDPEYR